VLENNLINLQDKFVESIGVFSPHAPTPSETVYHPTRKKEINRNKFHGEKRSRRQVLWSCGSSATAALQREAIS
jgi:hypothetical protein